MEGTDMAQRLLTLTCRNCDGSNPRNLPYSLREPDACEHCGSPFRTLMDVAIMDFQLWRKQSKLASAVEALANTFIGLLIAFVAQMLICWAYNIPLSPSDNAIIVFWMTVLSVLRSYVVRRIWNSEFWRRK